MFNAKKTICFFFTLLPLMPLCNASENGAFVPIPAPKEPFSEKAKLGKALFNDTLFSKDNMQSCASCHSLEKAGTDNLPRYIGLNKKEGALNTPTVLNSSLNFRQFWDARAHSIKDVITDHILDKTIFDNTWANIIEEIKNNKQYMNSFKENYKDNLTTENIQDALAAYLSTLLTPNSPFDRFLLGDKSALNADAQKGYELFKKYGCVTCHQGPNMGGNLVLPLSVYKPYFSTVANETNLKPLNATQKMEDKRTFKVPSLRNISLTGPYLHDGSVKSLEDMIKIMGVYEVGQPIPNYEIPYIVKFLESLKGELPAQETKVKLSPSGH